MLGSIRGDEDGNDGDELCSAGASSRAIILAFGTFNEPKIRVGQAPAHTAGKGRSVKNGLEHRYRDAESESPARSKDLASSKGQPLATTEGGQEDRSCFRAGSVTKMGYNPRAEQAQGWPVPMRRWIRWRIAARSAPPWRSADCTCGVAIRRRRIESNERVKLTRRLVCRAAHGVK